MDVSEASAEKLRSLNGGGVVVALEACVTRMYLAQHGVHAYRF